MTKRYEVVVTAFYPITLAPSDEVYRKRYRFKWFAKLHALSVNAAPQVGVGIWKASVIEVKP